jgi:anthranilate phosphoribosyltransferase
VSRYTLVPSEVGVELAVEGAGDARAGSGSPQENAAVTRAILEGGRGADSDLAVINAGAAIYAAGRAGTIAEGVELARTALREGSAAESLERFVKASERHASTAGVPR